MSMSGTLSRSVWALCFALSLVAVSGLFGNGGYRHAASALVAEKRKFINAGYTYAGNVNDNSQACSHSACDWDPAHTSSEDRNSTSGDFYVSQVVLRDGSRFIRKESRDCGSETETDTERVNRKQGGARQDEDEEGGACGQEGRNASMGARRKLNQDAVVWGPFDQELEMSGDDRVQVLSSHYPFSAVGQLDNGCTGTLIGPCHVLTAGHCVYDPQQRSWADKLGFTPGRSGPGGWEPNGRAEYVNKQVLMGWQLLSNFSSDIGMIMLNWRIGDRTGTVDVGTGGDHEHVGLNMAGYPNDKGNGEMWYDYCNGAHFDYYDAKVVYHKCTPDNGNSGSPLWVYKKYNGFRQIRAVHTGVVSDLNVFLSASDRSNVFNRQPYGVMITPEIRDIVKKWVEENQCY